MWLMIKCVCGGVNMQSQSSKEFEVPAVPANMLTYGTYKINFLALNTINSVDRQLLHFVMHISLKCFWNMKEL